MNDPITAAIRRVNDRVRTLELWVARQRSADAANAVYDNTTSGLTAADVQAALDELAGGAGAGPLDGLTDVNVPAPTDGQVLAWDDYAAEWVAVDLTVIDEDYANIVGFIDGGGAVPSTGTKCWVRVGFGGTIQEATTIADASGSCVVDVNKRAYGGGAATSICAAAKPTLSGAQEATDPTLTGWTTTFSAGDIFYFELESVATCQAIMVSLKVLKA